MPAEVVCVPQQDFCSMPAVNNGFVYSITKQGKARGLVQKLRKAICPSTVLAGCWTSLESAIRFARDLFFCDALGHRVWPSQTCCRSPKSKNESLAGFCRMAVSSSFCCWPNHSELAQNHFPASSLSDGECGGAALQGRLPGACRIGLL